MPTRECSPILERRPPRWTGTLADAFHTRVAPELGCGLWVTRMSSGYVAGLSWISPRGRNWAIALSFLYLEKLLARGSMPDAVRCFF